MQLNKMNPLLRIDEYKAGHMSQINPKCNRMYSYYCNRSDKYFQDHVFFGLQYYLKEYLSVKLEPWMADEFVEIQKCILGSVSPDVYPKIKSLCDLGHFPLKIKALPEGSVTKKGVPLFTMVNTVDGFQWVPGFVESLILKCWYTSVVATTSYKYRKLVNKLFSDSVDDSDKVLESFMVHDFGFRGDSSEEGAAISGVAHLCSFLGSDTVPAFKCAMQYYGANPDDGPIMLSVPASEHAVACSYGKEDEIKYFENMLDLYPSGIVSMVSDQYDVYKVLTEYAPLLKDKIMSRDGKAVWRPDSGNPEHIISGNPDATPNSPEYLGAVRILDNVFGSSVNSKGFKVLNPKIGLIYGDGMYYDRYERTQKRLMDLGYAAQNLVIGVGGILRNHSRDTLGVALKATNIELEGVSTEIFKDPITDQGKKSARGLLRVDSINGELVLKDRCTAEEEAGGLLEVVFENGKLVKDQTLAEIRGRLWK